MAEMVDGFDVASTGELGRVAHLGLPISFAGPGKRDQELETAIRARITVNLESEGEAERVLAICEREALKAKLAVRVNPPFGLKGSGQKMGGLPSQFGVDHDRVPGLVGRIIQAGAKCRGPHTFAGSQARYGKNINQGGKQGDQDHDQADPVPQDPQPGRSTGA